MTRAFPVAVSLPVLLAVLLAWAVPVRAQDGPSAGAGTGTLTDVSRPVGEGSGSVRDASRGSVGSNTLRDVSRPVRDGVQRSMRSGPVSESSAGSLREGRGMYGSGSIGASSAGAVTQPDHLPPLRMERPVTEADIRRLEEDLRDVELLPE